MTFVHKIKVAANKGVRSLWFNVAVKPLWMVRLLRNRKAYCVHASYFPDRKAKSSGRILRDHLMQILRHGSPNMFYFPYGMDVKSDEEVAQYMHYEPFSRIRDRLNGAESPASMTAVLRDKFLFGIFTDFFGISSASNLAISIPEGLFIPDTKQTVSLADFLANHPGADLFVKPIDGECGQGIIHLTVGPDGIATTNGAPADIKALTDTLSRHRYLVQKTVAQHPLMASLHPQSLNTIRLVTIRNPRTGRPDVFPSIIRIGTGKSIVDNTSQGGLAVGIDFSSGRLKGLGFYKPEFGTKVTEHPDSHIKFSDFTIPHFEECKRQAIFLHSMLPGLHSIGWDIAVGPDGPVFIEGNDNWEINGPQICNGPLRDLFLSYCPK